MVFAQVNLILYADSGMQEGGEVGGCTPLQILADQLTRYLNREGQIIPTNYIDF